MNSSKKNKGKAWIGTLLFHIALLIVFLFTGLSYTIPPPPEEGISINFGTTDFAEGENEIQEEQIEKVKEESTSENNPATEDITTQETIETVETKKEEKESKESTTKITKKEEEIEKTEEKVVKKRAIYNPNKNKRSEGNNPGEGDMGEEDGDPNSEHYKGGGFGDGLSTIGSYRSKPKDFDHPLEMGTGYITVNVIVNSDGKIIDIDDSSFDTKLNFIGETKKKNLYKAIKRDLKYGPETGTDKSNKVAELKINFKN